MDIESNIEELVCCICLNAENNEGELEEIKHIPCRCNLYCHKSCFDKTNTLRCFICKDEYKVCWGEIPVREKKNSVLFNLFVKLRDNINKTPRLISTYNCSEEYIYNLKVKSVILLDNVFSIAQFIGLFLCDLIMIGMGFFFMAFLLFIGGKFMNMFTCYEEFSYDKSCSLSYKDFMVYIIGIIGLPLLLLLISLLSCVIHEKKRQMDRNINRIVAY
jgi:hypothetical protein